MNLKKMTSFLVLLCLASTDTFASSKLEMSELGLFNAIVPEKEWTTEMNDLRSHKLEHHKKMGHITLGLMTATFASAVWAKHEVDNARASRGGLARPGDASKYHLHMGLAAASLISYFTTAYFSLSAPKPDNYPESPARAWHKGLAWIHGPAMILAPILGFLAFKDIHDGGDPSGLGKLHKPVMMAGFAAFAASYGIAVYNW